jgi:hypothetical protein
MGMVPVLDSGILVLVLMPKQVPICRREEVETASTPPPVLAHWM